MAAVLLNRADPPRQRCFVGQANAHAFVVRLSQRRIRRIAQFDSTAIEEVRNLSRTAQQDRGRPPGLDAEADGCDVCQKQFVLRAFVLSWLHLQRRSASLLLDSTGFVEIEPRRARAYGGRVPVAKIDKKVRLPPPIREEFRIDLRAIEAAHRPTVQTERACRQYEVTALQGAALKGEPLPGRLWQPCESSGNVGSGWRQLRHQFKKLRVMRDDSRCRRT